jgi:hypothetical protein
MALDNTFDRNAVDAVAFEVKPAPRAPIVEPTADQFVAAELPRADDSVAADVTPASEPEPVAADSDSDSEIDLRLEAPEPIPRSRQEIAQAFSVRAEEFAKEHPYFHAVVSNPQLRPLPQHLAHLVMTSSIGPALLLHMAKNPDVANRLSHMDEIQSTAALARVEASLVSQGFKPRQKTADEHIADARRAFARERQQPAAPNKKMTMQEFAAAERAKKLPVIQRRNQILERQQAAGYGSENLRRR